MRKGYNYFDDSSDISGSLVSTIRVSVIGRSSNVILLNVVQSLMEAKILPRGVGRDNLGRQRVNGDLSVGLSMK